MSSITNNLKVREVINQVVNDPEYKEVSHVPVFSIPQIGLFLFSCGLVFGGVFLASKGYSLWILYPAMCAGFYASFTILHDSTHRAVSSHKGLNDLLGTIAGNILFPFITAGVYRYFHLSHHRYVGDEHLDPDEPMVRIPSKYFPLGLLVIFAYEYFIFKWLFTKVWKKTPLKLRIAAVCSLGLYIIFNIAMFASPYRFEYLLYFFIPNRIGASIVVYLFAYLPHPEGLHWDEHPFHSTYNIKGNSFLLKSLLGQSSHAMHHFLPHVPWFKYHKVHSLANGIFRKQNIPERTVFSAPDTDIKHEVIANHKADKERSLITAQITEISETASDIKTFIFEPINGEQFPEFTAGSHLNLTLPSGKVRSYSLVNAPYEKNKYQIAVKRDINGKGGSIEVHDVLHEGMMIQISRPKNNFVLYENVQKFVLISGGIGITPLISMSHRLIELDKHFEFHICGRDEQSIPFSYELENWSFAPNTEIHLDKNGKSSLDIQRILSQPDKDTLIYLCGPAGFNNWIKDNATQLGWAQDQIKEELFTNASLDSLESKPFEVVLQKSNQTINVGKDDTIIDALLMNDIKVDYSCLQGTCGTCITQVVDGDIDHRDAVLRKEEQQSGKQMCICVSRAKGDRVVLDL